MDDQNLILMIGQIKAQTSTIEEKVSRIEKVVLGNGHTGLAEQHRILEVAVANHLKEAERTAQEQAKKKENFDAKTWAIVVLIIGQLLVIARSFIVP